MGASVTDLLTTVLVLTGMVVGVALGATILTILGGAALLIYWGVRYYLEQKSVPTSNPFSSNSSGSARDFLESKLPFGDRDIWK